MKTPAALVTAALTAAILLTATFLIATGTRGDGVLVPHNVVTRQPVPP
jgi:aldose sugar dehydrogenase